MRQHRIDLQPAYRQTEAGSWVGHGKAIMRYAGELIGESAQPLFDAARWLLDANVADPDDEIVTVRDGVSCLRAKVGVAAKLSVSEPDRGGGPRFAKWRAFTPP